MEQATRLANSTTLWRLYVQRKGLTPPFNAHIPLEYRALSEQMAIDMLAHYRPDLELVTDPYGNPTIERRSARGA